MNNSTLEDGGQQDFSGLTVAQDKALSLLPMFSGALSAWGSGSIIYMVLTSNKRTSYRRILLGLSCFDFIASIMLSFQAFFVPADTSHRIWAMGNDKTCTALGFFQQLSFSNLWYNGMLSFYFLLTITYGVREVIMAKRYEPWMHILSIGFGVVTATVGAVLGFYNELDVGHGCWVSDYPDGCGCQDGAQGECCKSPLIAWIYGGLPFCCFSVAILVNNLLVYRHVKHTIQKSRAYSQDYNTATHRDSMMDESIKRPPDEKSTLENISGSLKRWSSRRRQASESDLDPQAKRIRAVATQSFLYVAAFVTVIIPGGILRILEWMNVDDEGKLFPLLLINAILWPLQGFFNCFVFLRPSYQKVRKDFPNEGRFWAVRRALYGTKVHPTDEMH